MFKAPDGGIINFCSRTHLTEACGSQHLLTGILIKWTVTCEKANNSLRCCAFTKKTVLERACREMVSVPNVQPSSWEKMLPWQPVQQIELV